MSTGNLSTEPKSTGDSSKINAPQTLSTSIDLACGKATPCPTPVGPSFSRSSNASSKPHCAYYNSWRPTEPYHEARVSY